jgi:hypothetical protein
MAILFFATSGLPGQDEPTAIYYAINAKAVKASDMTVY